MKSMEQKKASEINLSEKQKQILEEYSKSTHQPMHLKIRSEIILQASRGISNNTIEKTMQISPRRVK